MMKLDRMPVITKPGYDCWRDNANCPACSAGKVDDHGIYGGGLYFGVAATVNGVRTALVLDVLAHAYPASVPRPLRPEVAMPRGGVLGIHRHVVPGDACDWLGKLPCVCVTAGFGRAKELYEQYGNMSPDPKLRERDGELMQVADYIDQTEEFWAAMERQFFDWCVP